MGHSFSTGRAAVLAFKGAASAPPDEVSYVSSGAAWSSKTGYATTNPDDLIGKKGLAEYRAMRLDGTVHGIMSAMLMLAVSTPWYVEPASDDRLHMKQADEIDSDLDGAQGTLARDLMDMATALYYGWSNTEIVRIADGLRWRLHSFKTREPDGWSFDTDPHGNLRENGLWQNIGTEPLKLSPLDFIIYSYKKEHDNWYGSSHLRAAHTDYFAKLWVGRFWTEGLEKAAAGIFKGTLPENPGKDDKENLEAAMAGLQSNSYLLLPHGTQVELMELRGAGAAAFLSALKYRNFQIAVALLAPEQTGFTQTDHGSNAKAMTQTSTWMALIEAVRADLLDLINEQFIKRQIDDHYGPGATASYPRLAFQPLVKEDLKAFMEQAVMGVRDRLIHWSREDEVDARKRLNMVELSEDVIDQTTGATVEAATMSFPAMMFTAGRRRKPTRYERHVNLTAIEDRQDKLEATLTDELSRLMELMQDETLKKVDKLLAKRTLIDNFSVRHVGDMTRAFKAALISARLGGKLDIKGEYESAMGVKLTLDADAVMFADSVTMIPEAARKYFKGKVPFTDAELAKLAKDAFFITGVQRDQIVKECKFVLYRGLKKGDPHWTRTQLRLVFEKYIQTSQVKNDALMHPWRIETIVRTNLADAWSGGREAMLKDPDVDKDVVGYQWSSILDGNTTDFCAAYDGRVFDKDDVERPPAHMNCRSFIVPVFRGETYTKSVTGDVRDEYRKMPEKDRYHGGLGRPINPDKIVRGDGF